MIATGLTGASAMLHLTTVSRIPSATIFWITWLPPIKPAVSSSGGMRRPVKATLAPARANAIAQARPIPLPAPVIHATLPSSDPI